MIDQIDTAEPAALNAKIEAVAKQVPQIDFAVQRGMLTHGVPTPLDWVKAILNGYTIKGLADRITCPTLVCEAEQDIRGGDAKPLYDGSRRRSCTSSSRRRTAPASTTRPARRRSSASGSSTGSTK